MKRLAALAGSLLLVLTISSCGAATGPVGTWGDGYNTDKLPYLELSLLTDQASPEFEQRGFVTGSDGCNRISGQWSQKGDQLAFGQLASTLIACEGIDPWLLKAEFGTLDGDTMTLLDANGNPVGTLDRRN